MEQTNDQFQVRLEKRAKLLEKGIDPYGGRFEVSETIAAARANSTAERDVRLAGRVTSHRDMGKSMFADLKDSTGRIQLYVQKKVLNDEQKVDGWCLSCRAVPITDITISLREENLRTVNPLMAMFAAYKPTTCSNP